MRYLAEMNFSDRILEEIDYGLDFVKREIALKIIKDMPIEHLEAIFKYDITYFSDKLTPENRHKHYLIRELRQNRMNHLQAEIETNYP